MEAFDTNTGQPIVVDNPEQMREGVLSGQFGFKKDAKINVFKGDEVYSIPSGDVYNALNNGWEIETPNLTAVREYLKENDNLIGSLKVGAYEFANALAMGVPDIIMRNTANPLEWAKLNALRDEHVTASLLGEVSGIGANIYSLARSGVLAATEKISEKAVNTVANRIMATLGKDVSKSAANQAAKGILAKTASKLTKGVGIVGRNVGQAAIEGAIDMAVPASVEALFGNYDEAAETLLIGTAFGGLLGGSLRTAGDAFSGAKQSLTKSLGQSVGEEGTKLQETLLQGLSTQTNIPIDTLRYGLKNAKDVDNALPMEAHFDSLNQAARSEFDIYETAKADLKNIEDDLAAKTKIKARQMDELSKAPNKEVDDQIVNSTSWTKRWLEDQSAAAEEALANEITIPKIDMRDVKKKVDNAINLMAEGKVGKTVGQTLSSLEGISNDLAAIDNFIDGNLARNVMRNIREDIRFNEADPTLFDSKLDKVLKDIQRNISERLKTYSPTYKAQMEKMAPAASALEQLGPMVSTENKRLAVGKALSTTTPSPSQQSLLNRFERFMDAAEGIEGLENIREVFDEAVKNQKAAVHYKKNLSKMLDIKTSDAKDQFYKMQFPEEYELLGMKRANLGEAQLKWDALKPLVTSDGRVPENNIKVFDGEKNIALERAYDELSKRYPSELGNIKKQIKDTKIKDSFGKARTQGSRLTNLYGGLIGGTAGATFGIVGAFLGGAVGAYTGAYVDRFGGRMFEKLLKESPGASKIRSFLVAEKQMSKFANGLDKIPDHIEKIATKKDRSSAIRKINRATNYLLFRIMDREKEQPQDKLLDRKTRVEAFNAFSKKLSELSNRDMLLDELSTVSGAAAEGGSVGFGQKTMEKMAIGIEYLQREIPKDPNPGRLFVKKGQEWEPSDYDLRAFEEKLLVIEDPFVVFDALEGDILTANHVDALRAVYPSLYSHITTKVLDTIATSESDLSYTDKVGLSEILGMPIDQSMTIDNFAYFQTAQLASEQGAAAAQGPANLSKIKMETSDYQTLSQRIRNI